MGNVRRLFEPFPKLCRQCNETKPELDFGVDRTASDGRKSYCRKCAKRIKARWVTNLPFGDYQARTRKYHFKRMYGLTEAALIEMRAAQGDKCPICLSTFSDNRRGKKAAYVDHDHETRAVRALLCSDCNIALGNFNDDADALRRAAEYIEKHKGRH